MLGISPVAECDGMRRQRVSERTYSWCVSLHNDARSNIYTSGLFQSHTLTGTRDCPRTQYSATHIKLEMGLLEIKGVGGKAVKSEYNARLLSASAAVLTGTI